MDKKSMLINLLDFALDARTNLGNKLTPAEKATFGTWETWSPKDTLAHIAHWLDTDIKNLEMEHGTIPVFDENNLDEENRKIYEKWAKKSWSEIEAFYNETVDRAKKFVQSMNENRLLSSLERADGTKRPIWQSITGRALSHMTSHIAFVYRRLGDLEAATGIEEETATLLHELDDSPAWRATVQYNLACNYALIGQNNRAIALLKEALNLDSNLIEWSKKDPDFDKIRDDAEFAKVYGTR